MEGARERDGAMRRLWWTVLGLLLGTLAALLPEVLPEHLPPIQMLYVDAIALDVSRAAAPPAAAGYDTGSAGATPLAGARPRLASLTRDPAVAWIENRLARCATGEHYRVHTDLPLLEAEAALAILERWHPRFRARFAADPSPSTADGLLPVYVYSDRVVYRLGPSHGSRPWPPERAGYYDPRGFAQVERGVDAALFEATLVHEAAHQFHRLALGAGGPLWYSEGVAHDLAWELESLADDEVEIAPLARVGPRPVERRLLGGYAALLENRVDLAELLAGKSVLEQDEAAARGLGFVLVRFLRHGADGRYRQWFDGFERAVAEQRTPPPFALVPLKQLREELLTFALGLRPPMATQIAWSGDEVAGELAVDGERACVPMLEWPRAGQSAKLTALVNAAVGESVGFALCTRDGQPRWILRFDPQGSFLVIERVAGERIVPVAEAEARARVRPPLSIELSVAADGTVSVARSGIELHHGPLMADPADLVLGFYAQAGARSRFRPTFAFQKVTAQGAVLESARRPPSSGQR